MTTANPASGPTVRATTAMNSPAPMRGNRAKPTVGPYRSQCKICDWGVYTGQAAVWLTQPMGLSHTGCAVQAGLVPA